MSRSIQVWGATLRVVKGTPVRDTEKGKDVLMKKDWIGLGFSRRVLGVYSNWWFTIGQTTYWIRKDRVEVLKEFRPKEIEALLKHDHKLEDGVGGGDRPAD